MSFADTMCVATSTQAEALAIDQHLAEVEILMVGATMLPREQVIRCADLIRDVRLLMRFHMGPDIRDANPLR